MSRVLLDIKATRPMLGDLLNERYRIVQVLSSGAFGRTYIAEDVTLADAPKCIIRHLKPANDDPNLLPFVKYLFRSETKTLQTLGQHDRIPKLLSLFEDNQGYYLVQEFIPGQLLSSLLPLSPRSGKRWSENRVIQLLQEVLEILEFVHSQGTIHCDIKPNNLIKRADDGKICLIDFGAVQPIPNYTEQASPKNNLSPAGYIPAEQLAYQPRPSSDIYALGMIAIQALSGIHPSQLELDSQTGEIAWQQQVEVSAELAFVINLMVQYCYEDRYQTATEALRSVRNLANLKQAAIALPEAEVLEPNVLERSIFAKPQTTEAIAPNVQSLDEVLDLTTPLSQQIQYPLGQENIIPSVLTNTLGTIPNHQTGKSVIKPRQITPMMKAFGVGMAVNAAIGIAGFIYISQPDPNQFKTVDEVLNRLPWEEMAEKVCEVPIICFWQK